MPKQSLARSRRAGVLVPLFSLRRAGGWGVGDIADLPVFARWAASSGFSVVQILPVNAISPGQNSPYTAASAFAIDPIYLSLDDCADFVAIGGRQALTPAERATLGAADAALTIDWDLVRTIKGKATRLAFARFYKDEWQPQTRRARLLADYVREAAPWLDEWTLFAALHQEHRGAPWTSWAPPLRDRDPGALDDARVRLGNEALFGKWLQWQLEEQWRHARDQALALGVELMGDLPFVVATDSADVWTRREELRLDARLGVPPDAFSTDGQDWGLPVYRWDAMEASGDFGWFRQRARRAADLCQLLRIDHAVGLYRTYFRPDDGGNPGFTPVEPSKQLRLGEGLFDLLANAADIVAEDLGTVPDFVRDSLTRLGIPGYRVLRWEKDDGVFRDPAEWPVLSVATTGTHDTEAIAEWYDALSEDEHRALLALPGLEALRARAPVRFDAGVRDALLELVYATPSCLALVPFQDAIGARERVNVPGTVAPTNWSYRLPMTLAELAADHTTTDRLAAMATRTDRKQRKKKRARTS